MAGVPARPDAFFRLGPVERSRALCYGVTRGEIAGRTDVNFWRLTPLFHQRFANPRFPTVTIRQVVDIVQYGCSSLAKAEPVGVPMLRMNNLQNDGWDLSDLKYIAFSDKELASYRLEKGDLLFNRTNSKELVGKCEVFRESGDWVFASYLIRVRLNDEIIPQFASDFLNTSAGRLQIDRFSRQIIGMTNINAEELQEILIPRPPKPKQEQLVAAMDSARASRCAKLAEANALLAGLDSFLLDAIRLEIPPKPTTTFAIRVGELTGVLNPDRYRGLQLEKHLPFKTSVDIVGALLESRCNPEREAPKDLWDWIRIDDLPNHPWQVETLRTETGEDIKGTFFEVQEGDVLVGALGQQFRMPNSFFAPSSDGKRWHRRNFS